MDNLTWGTWVYRVCSHIKFKPDRAAVEEELRAHLEDKAEALCRGEVTMPEAKRQALAAMGDPDEVGRQLASVHKAWLGYLWVWSRRALILCVVAAAWLALGFSDRVNFTDSPVRYWQGFPYYQEDKRAHYQFTELTPDCTDKSDGLTFTVPAAEVIRNEAFSVREEYEGETYEYTVEDGTSLYLTVRATWLWPGTAGCTAFFSFYAVDDLGNTYVSAEDNWSGGGRTDERVLNGNGGIRSLWSSEYYAWISFLDPEAQWIELRYDRDGRDVRLRIDLTGGGGT